MKKTFYALLSTALVFLFASGIMAQGDLTITAPAGVAGDYNYIQATFGPAVSSISGELVLAEDGSGANTACNAITNDLTGKIALIDRGACGFATKAANAQNAGAIAVVICNSDQANPDAAIYMGGTPAVTMTIPSVMISYNDCQTIRVGAGLTGTLNPPEPGEACYTAISLPGPGNYTASAITSTGATVGTGDGAKWYSYTPTADGSVNVNSCASGVNTFLAIMADDGCPLPSLITTDDNSCPNGLGSTIDFLGYEGTTYYLQWTDANTADGFEFEVSLNSLPTVNVTMTVDMLFETVANDGVFIVGNFNNWTPEAMTDNGDGTWSHTVSVTSLDEVLWNYQNGMGNTEPTANLGPCGQDDGMGSINRVFVAASLEDIDVSSTCYGSCADCIPTDCDDPIELIDEDFDGMTAGMSAADQSGDFAPWPGGAASLVSAEQANSGANSLKIDGTSGTEDNLVLFGDKTSGHYKLSFNVYAESGMGWYFNIQKVEGAPGQEYAIQFDCQVNGESHLDAGVADAVIGDCSTRDQWVNVTIYFDLDNDWARLYIGNEFVYGWPYNWTTFTTAGLLQLGSMNLFPIDPNYIFYVDDVVFAAVPPAAPGSYCADATAAVEGTNSIAGPIECFGGHDPDNAEGAVWFSYTASADGVIAVGACNGGADTRVWIFEGDCQTLPVVGINDDRCADGTGTAFASYREVPVTSGETYYIMWDNVWDANGFDWDLTFNAGDGAEGNFCNTAIPIQPGTHTVGLIDGEAAVTGPIIGNTSQAATPTAYAQSEWYSFTPTESGLMNIYTCDLTNEDTRVWVYTGTCDNFNTLNWVAFSDDDCAAGAGSLISEFQAVAGTTYYIEWDGVFTDGNFDFELELFQTREVTFILNMEDETVDIANGGARIAGDFTNWSDVGMTNNFDGTWSYTTTLRQGETYNYKFQNGSGGWEDSANLGDCGVDDGFGGFNRTITVGDMDMTVGPVCFKYCVDCDLVIDVSEIDFEQGIALNPNPAKAMTTLSYNFDEALNLTIEVVDITGKLLHASKVEGAQSGNVLLDVSAFTAGVYQVRITSEQHQVTKRLVVQR